MMKFWLRTLLAAALTASATSAIAHPGHGLGILGHDLQHQLWIFGALVVVGVVCMLSQGRNSDQE